ncbi:uncharacterized protein TNCV_2788321 [Trichonephila clavipes]|uniref:Uncharacterized protein n=1 Tax=Trichonephila clavipes TaxID=2585209 RepID=A0A8X6SSP3_TRICX|nr:uncharacterized protein TNCV_2788321 [Trichonephila clavipes]
MFPICLSDGDYLEECAEQEICKVLNGIARANQCINMLSKKDIDITTKILLSHYTEAKDLKDVMIIGCKNVPEAKPVLMHFLEEKDKMNITYTAEESMKIVQSRACLALMITECQLKKAMGFTKFG